MRTIYWRRTDGVRVSQQVEETDDGLVLIGEPQPLQMTPAGCHVGRSATAASLSPPRWTRWGDGLAWCVRRLGIRWKCPSCDCRRRCLNCLGATTWQGAQWLAREVRLAFGSA